MQAVIIPPRFNGNYQIFGLPRQQREYFSSLDICHLHPAHMPVVFNVTFIKSHLQSPELHCSRNSFQVGQLLLKPCSALGQHLWRMTSPHSSHFQGITELFRLKRTIFAKDRSPRAIILYSICLFCTGAKLTCRGLVMSGLRTFHLITCFPIGGKKKPVKD